MLINNLEVNKKFIEKNLLKNGKLNKNKIKKYFNCTVSEISETLYLIYYNLKDSLKCECGKKFNYISFQSGYSNKCDNKECRSIKKFYTIEEKGLEYFNSSGRFKQLIYDKNIYESGSEFLYCYKNELKEPLKCKCGRKLKFISLKEGYFKFCSTKCAAISEETKQKRKQTNLERYGVEIPSQLKEFSEKQVKTTKEKYGNGCNYEKYKQTMLEKYGVENYFAIPGFNQSNPEKYKKISESLKGRSRPDMDPNIKKRIKTCLERYGVEHYVQSEVFKQKASDIAEKIFQAKIRNKTTNTSKTENEIFEYLKLKYNNVIREYKSEKYPFHCDFYIEDLDLYIEYQGFFSHNFKSFQNTKEDIEKLNIWKEKAKSSKFYENSIITWTVSDVKKRNTAFKNKLKYLEIFDINDIDLQIDRVLNGIKLEYNEKELYNEYNKIYSEESTLNKSPNHNKIVLTFQKHFFEKENEIYKNNPILRRKLIENRIKYLNKKENELSNRELLSGFKISGIYNSYSYFSPHWFKYFIEKYNIKSVYDPFGGWGHRILGSKNLDLYIYNDISKRTFEGCENIVDFLNLKNIKLYNYDSKNFIPEEDFDSIFMCPPYDNLEEYDIKIKNLSDCFENISRLNYRICGIIIKENYEELIKKYFGNFINKKIVNNKRSHFGKKQFEYLYVFKNF